MTFKDHFSERAPLYAKHRPKYPDSLFGFLAAMAPGRETAWDCATGSGQAAVGLAEYFDNVIATDASDAQIAEAEPHPRIEYRVAPAHDSGIESAAIDLTTVAQAMHWLDPAAFYAEAARVTKPGGVVAIWGYGDPVFDDPAIHDVVHAYNRGTIEHCWRPERQTLLDGYMTIEFPFDEMVCPRFDIEVSWNLAELAGYLRTWSATVAFARQIGRDPIVELESQLASYWGKKEERHRVRWPLFLRAGKV